MLDRSKGCFSGVACPNGCEVGSFLPGLAGAALCLAVFRPGLDGVAPLLGVARAVFKVPDVDEVVANSTWPSCCDTSSPRSSTFHYNHEWVARSNDLNLKGEL